MITPTYEFNETIADNNPFPNNWRKIFLKLGQLFNKTAVAKAAIQNYNKEVAAAMKEIHNAIGNQSVAMLYVSGKTLGLIGNAWWDGAPVLYDDLCLTPPTFSKGKSFADISIEELPELNADDIFVIDTDASPKSNPLFSNPVWKHLAAVRNNHVYHVLIEGCSTNSHRRLKQSVYTRDHGVSIEGGHPILVCHPRIWNIQ